MAEIKRTPNPAKAALRTKMDEILAQLTPEERKRQTEIVVNKIINHPFYKSAKRISLFMSLESEIDTMPIIKHIKARGASAYVPQYLGGKMRMLKLDEGDETAMKPTRHGILQHSKDMVREEAMETGGLDLIIAPGVAFTKSGARLGHGAGYYDKFITSMRAGPNPGKVVAVAFSCQILEEGEVPMDEFDQRVDDVVYAD